jgi:hypothetical protein
MKVRGVRPGAYVLIAERDGALHVVTAERVTAKNVIYLCGGNISGRGRTSLGRVLGGFVSYVDATDCRHAIRTAMENARDAGQPALIAGKQALDRFLAAYP